MNSESPQGKERQRRSDPSLNHQIVLEMFVILGTCALHIQVSVGKRKGNKQKQEAKQIQVF